MSKRNAIFGPGRPEAPYEELSGGDDVPQRATAAQLATRKIKSAKARSRPAGASVSSQSANFSAPLPNFNFGASAPAPGNNSNNNIFDFNTNSAFGSGATNSFPPAQSSAPSNSFVNSSFPAFGASNQNTGFNPQPPTAGFSFTAGNNNPFASSESAPATNGATSTTPTFGAFGSQPSSNPFGGLGQNNTTSSASGGIFGTTSSTSSTSLFGTTNSTTPNAVTTPTSASQPFSFGAPSSTTHNTTSTPAANSIFGGLSTAAQPATPAPNNIFSGFGANAQKNEPTPSTNNIFSGFGTSAQATESTVTAAPASGIFNFSSAPDTKATAAPSANLFGFSSSVATPSTPALTSASNPFASLPTTSSASSSLFKPLDPTPQTPQTQEKPQPSSNSLFGNIKPLEQTNSVPAEIPKPDLFASLGKTNMNPTATPAAAPTPGFSLFGATQNKDSAPSSDDKPSGTATLKAPEAPKSGLFNGFSTPQPAKSADSVAAQGGLFSAAQPKMSSGIFSQSFKLENPQSGGFPKTQSLFLPAAPATSMETSNALVQQAKPNETPNIFSKLDAPTSQAPSLFSAAKDPPPASPSSTMPTLTGAATASNDTPKAPEMPKIPKMHVPNSWAVPPAMHHGVHQQVSDLAGQLQALNLKYRERLSGLPARADWSSLSLWHHKHASHLKKQIDDAKKQRAAGKGVTGNESTLSTKRKVNDESPEARNVSPTKRARAGGVTATPTPQASTPQTKANPPPTSTSNMFAKAIGNKASAPTASPNLFAPKTAEKSHVEPSKPAAPAAGFTPFLSASSSTGNSKSAPASTGFKPNTGGAASGGGFFSQFAKNAKTYEELAAERKAKAKAEDFDSDDETEEEWSARYDKKETERLAAEKKEVASARSFSVPPSSKASGSSPPASNPFASLNKPTSGASTSGLFNSRVGSPALSTGGQSVFDAPSTAQTPSSNIFGHLSSGPSSNNQDDSDGEAGEPGGKLSKDQPIGSVESTTPPKQKAGESETDSDDTLEETMRRKKQNTRSKGSLLSRMTRDDDGDGGDSEKENSISSSIFGQVNGTQTPNKLFPTFDFGAAGSGSTTPKPDLFAGDQTFKPGTPIKFAPAASAETKSATPKFVFQPATPSAAELSTTPAKPPPTSIFSFGSSTGGSSLFVPGAGFSGAPSVTSSVFSSRAGTPMSEAENSAASAAEDEDEGKQEQVDFSQLTEEETNANDVVFHADVVLAKHQVDKGDGVKAWTSLAKGPLWILKDKVTAKCFIRIRIPSGATPLDYRLLPSIQASVTGSSKKMIMATKPAKEGGLQQVLYAVKTPEIAEEFARKYNESLPSS